MQTRSKLDAVADTLPSPGLFANAPPSSTTDSRDSGPIDSPRLESGPVPSETSPGAATSSPSAQCLSDDAIVEYRQGTLSRADLDRIDLHLDACAGCRELVELVIADDPDELTSASQVTTFHRGFAAAGRYEILSFLGKGGMGEVYAALDQLTGKRVALKTVLCTATDDARAVRNLFDEVLNAQRVAHPHVFKIFDLHEHRDTLRGRVPFFTMEFIEGESLGARLRRGGALPVGEVAIIARQLLAGLAAAHARGVLHLDFKSDNVMLRDPSPPADAVIMDFGLSRAPDAESRQRTSERLQLAGTLPYMSIEQLECQPNLGPASDVYSFGVVLYEMLTGQLPFRGETFSAILLKQVRERPVPPSRYVPRLSQSIDSFVLKCLARTTRDRFGDAERALQALEEISCWQLPTPPSKLRRAARLGALLVVIVAASAALHAALNRRHASVQPPSTAMLDLRQGPAPAVPPAAAATARSEPPVGADRSPQSSASERGPAVAPEPHVPSSGGTAPAVAPRAPASNAPALPGATRGLQTGHPQRPTPLSKTTPPKVPSSTPPVTEAAPDRAPVESSGWRGPPPQHVPRPRPL